MQLIILLAVIGLSVVTITDIAKSDSSRIEVMPKGLWFVMALIPLFGPIAWFLAGRPQNPRSAKPQTKRSGPAKGPDDDPDFLWKIEKKMRQQKKEPGAEPEANPT